MDFAESISPYQNDEKGTFQPFRETFNRFECFIMFYFFSSTINNAKQSFFLFLRLLGKRLKKE